MSNYLPASEIAGRLAKLYRAEFGGKKLGRFTITRDDFKELAERESLHPSVVHGAADALIEEHGILLIDRGAVLCAIQEKKVISWRKVPAKLVRAMLGR